MQSWIACANCGLDKSIPARASESNNCSMPSTTPTMRPFSTGSLELGSASGKLDSILAMPSSTLRSIPKGSKNARFLSILPISTSFTAVLSTIQPAMSNGRLWPANAHVRARGSPRVQRSCKRHNPTRRCQSSVEKRAVDSCCKPATCSSPELVGLWSKPLIDQKTCKPQSRNGATACGISGAQTCSQGWCASLLAFTAYTTHSLRSHCTQQSWSPDFITFR